MRTTSSTGFDLREAIDAMRDALGPRLSEHLGRAAGEAAHDIRSAILRELAVEPMHGYQLIRAIAERTDGAWTPDAGAVYPTLQLLVDEGLATADLSGERKVYTLTATGRAAADALTTDTGTADASGAGPSRAEFERALAVPKAGARLARVAAEFPRGASAEQQERAVAVLDDARRRLHAILAEE